MRFVTIFRQPRVLELALCGNKQRRKVYACRDRLNTVPKQSDAPSADAVAPEAGRNKPCHTASEDRSLDRQEMPDALLSAVDHALDRPPRDVPAMQLTKTLEEAGPRTFVHIDSQGRVRPPTQYRMMQAASYAMPTTILVGGSVLYAYLWARLALFPLVFGSLVGRNLLITRRINQAALCHPHDRLDEAEAIFAPTSAPSGTFKRRLRALVHHNLARLRPGVAITKKP